jgi:hypothetical protein
MATQRTVEEAKVYINESIAYWESTKDENQLKKINSLANWAEKWRSGTGGHVSKMRDIQKNINAYKAIMKRKLKISSLVDNTLLQKELDAWQNSYDHFVKKHGELPPNQPKKPKKPMKTKIQE